MSIPPSELLLRCRSFVLRTQGQWTEAAASRLADQLRARGLTGSVPDALRQAAAERWEDAVYVCTGGCCVKRSLPRPEAGLPIRETACLGACQHAPSAHRVIGGTGQTWSALEPALLQTMVDGVRSPALMRRLWRAGETFPSPKLTALDGLVGSWSGPGGFSTPDGCTRSLQVGHVLGGHFIELSFVSAWPAVTGEVDRYAERLTLQASEDGFRGVFLDYRGQQKMVTAAMGSAGLIVVFAGDASRRRVLSLHGDGLSERQEHRRDEGWRRSFGAALRRSEKSTPLRARMPT